MEMPSFPPIRAIDLNLKLEPIAVMSNALNALAKIVHPYIEKPESSLENDLNEMAEPMCK
jgi:hypothetical protein